MAVAPDKVTVITRRDGTKETILTSGKTGKRTVKETGKSYNPSERFARSAVRSSGKRGFRVAGKTPGGFEDKPKTIKQERRDIEYAPKGMKEPEKQGYVYSGAIGYHRYPASARNMRIARQQLQRQQQSLRNQPKGTRIMYGKQELSVPEAQNRIAKQQIEINKLDQELRSRREEIQSQRALPAKNNNTIAVKSAAKSTNINNNRDSKLKNVTGMQETAVIDPYKPINEPETTEQKIGRLKEHRDELSWMGKKSVAAQRWLLGKKNVVVDDLKQRQAKTKVDGPFPDFLEDYASKTGVSVVDYGLSIPAGIAGMWAFGEQSVRHPKDVVTIGAIAAKGMAEHASTDPVGLMADISAGVVIGGGVAKAGGYVKHTAMKPKIVNTKFAGAEKYTMYGKHGSSLTTGKLEITTKTPLGKPKNTNYRVNQNTNIALSKKNTYVRGESNTRVIKIGEKPSLKVTKTDFEGSIHKTGQITGKDILGNKFTQTHTKAKLDIADYSKNPTKLQGHHKSTIFDNQQIFDMGKIKKGDITIQTQAGKGKILDIKHTGKGPTSSGDYAGASKTISGGKIRNPVTIGKRGIRANMGNLFKNEINWGVPKKTIPQSTIIKPTTSKTLDFSWMKDIKPKTQPTVLKTSAKNIQPKGSLRMDMSVSASKDAVLKNMMRNVDDYLPHTTPSGSSGPAIITGSSIIASERHSPFRIRYTPRSMIEPRITIDTGKEGRIVRERQRRELDIFMPTIERQNQKQRNLPEAARRGRGRQKGRDKLIDDVLPEVMPPRVIQQPQQRQTQTPRMRQIYNPVIYPSKRVIPTRKIPEFTDIIPRDPFKSGGFNMGMDTRTLRGKKKKRLPVDDFFGVKTHPIAEPGELLNIKKGKGRFML